MKTIPLLALILSALLFTSCAMSTHKGCTELGVPFEINCQGVSAVQGISIGQPWSSRQGELLNVTIELINNGPFPINVRTLFSWNNKYGIPIKSPGNVPELHNIPPGTSKTLNNVAPSTRAHAFKLKITEAN